MATKIDITFNPKGFAEVLASMSGTVQEVAEKKAAIANSYVTKGSGFHVEMSNEPRFKDEQHGVSRPVARIVSNDEETAAEEAENKILSRAITE